MKLEPQHIGVCIILLDKKGQSFLAGKRKNSYKSGMYGMPGGRAEFAEHLLDTGKRELKEETGLQAKSLDYIGVVREKQAGYHFISFVYACKTYQGEISLTEPDKCESWEWFPLTKPPQTLLPGHKAGLDIFLNPNIINFTDI